MSMNLHGLKRQALIAALDRHNGNRTRAAKDLGVSLRTVRNWIKQLEIEGPALQSNDYGPGYLNRVIDREIDAAMAAANGHKHKAATMLGISYGTLWKRLKQARSKWSAKPHAKPPMFCTKCNGRMNARSWIVKHTIIRGRDFIVRHGPGRSIWFCVKGKRHTDRLAALIEAGRAYAGRGRRPPAHGMVSKAEADKIRRNIEK